MNTETKAADEQRTQTRRGCCCGPMGCAPEDARAVLDRRYANGEITKEQYEEMRRDIESDRSQASFFTEKSRP